MVETKLVGTKIKRKKWFPIIAPKIFRNTVLGETYVSDEQSMLGKNIKVNLMSLTGDIKKQNIEIDFVVEKVENNKAIADIIGYHMVTTSVKRLVRRSSHKLENSFSCQTSDGKKIRIKTLILTFSTTKGTILSRLRATSIDYIIKTIKKLTYNNLINELVTHKFQESLKNNLKKIYPLRACEIRYMGIEKEGKTEKVAAEEFSLPAISEEKQAEPQVSEKIPLQEQ